MMSVTLTIRDIEILVEAMDLWINTNTDHHERLPMSQEEKETRDSAFVLFNTLVLALRAKRELEKR